MEFLKILEMGHTCGLLQEWVAVMMHIQEQLIMINQDLIKVMLIYNEASPSVSSKTNSTS